MPKDIIKIPRTCDSFNTSAESITVISAIINGAEPRAIGYICVNVPNLYEFIKKDW